MPSVSPSFSILPIAHRIWCYLVRNKELTRQVRVVNSEEYEAAKALCLDSQRERRKFENQRRALKHAALR
jgi:hypothetical protein